MRQVNQYVPTTRAIIYEQYTEDSIGNCEADDQKLARMSWDSTGTQAFDLKKIFF